ncbi:MAG: hypothetical protein IPK19_10610 [Chloroflexi bacterium]|nr:hypothetical protein [Chloroflexota bacterium]
MGLDYVIISNIITDDVVLADGTEHQALLGGAGTYAVSGARIWADRVGIVSGVGQDFDALYGAWFARNGIDCAGLTVRDLHTPHSWVRYAADGERTETPQFGSEHFRQMEPWPIHMPVEYWRARGIYVFRDATRAYWQELFLLRPATSGVLMWEIAASAAHQTSWNDVAWILPQVDLFSLNLTEGRMLTGLDEPDAIVDRLLNAGAGVVALRQGARGALVADEHRRLRIPACPVTVVDVTGGGNAFCGGFLAGYCESAADLHTAGFYGSVSASFVIEQYGQPPDLRDVRESARARVHALQSNAL